MTRTMCCCAIGLGKDRSDADRMRYDRGLYFKSAPEMAARFPDHSGGPREYTPRRGPRRSGVLEDVPGSLVPVAAGVRDRERALVRLAEEGARARYGDPLPTTVREALDYSSGLITKDRLRRLTS